VEAQMATYRAYFVDGEKHIQKARDFDANTDDEALQHAKQWQDGFLIEVWQQGTFVGIVSRKM
jgi:hypothetical protein